MSALNMSATEIVEAATARTVKHGIAEVRTLELTGDIGTLKRRITELEFALRTVLGDADHGQHMTWEQRCLVGRKALEKKT